MKGKFTAIIEAAPEGGYWAICPEIPGANGQGKSVATAKTSLRAAIRFILRNDLRMPDAVYRRALSGPLLKSSGAARTIGFLS